MTGTLTGKLVGDVESRAVIFVDNSASMAVHTDDGTLLDRAKSSLPAILNGLEGETTVELYQTNPPRKLPHETARQDTITLLRIHWRLD